MSQSTLRRTGAFLASAGLLASLTVATAVAPASAGGCEPFEGTFEAGVTCYYATGPTGELGNATLSVPEGVTLNLADDRNYILDNYGTVNGGGDRDRIESNYGTFNGGGDDDMVAGYANFGTFNGGPDNDYVTTNIGTFNGGGGVDGVTSNYGTFAGGGGSDCYGENTATVWSAALGVWAGGVCGTLG